MEGSGGGALTQPRPAKDVDEAALALTKRARKRSRYLSPPYTDTDVQEEEVAGEEEEEPPDVSAGDALSVLQTAALWHGEGQGVDPAAIRFLALYRNRNRATTGTFDNHPDSRAAAAGGGSHDGGSAKSPSPAAGGVVQTVLDLSAGPAMPRPADGSPAPALAKKKKNPQVPPAVKQQDGPMQKRNAAALGQAADGHIRGSQSAGFAVNVTYGVANPAPPVKKYKKRRKITGQEHKHFGNPVALVLDFAAGIPLPTKEDLISTFRRFGFVINSETAIAQDKRSARVAFATRAEAEVAYSCAGTLGAFGPPYVVPSLQDLPPIVSSAPPPVPKLPLTDIRNNLEKMISSLNRRSSLFKDTAAANSPEEAMPAMRNLVGEMQCLLAKVDKILQSPAATAHHG